MTSFAADRVRNMLWELAQRPGIKIGMWGNDTGLFSITDDRRPITWAPQTYSIHGLSEGWTP